MAALGIQRLIANAALRPTMWIRGPLGASEECEDSNGQAGSLEYIVENIDLAELEKLGEEILADMAPEGGQLDGQPGQQLPRPQFA